MSWGMHMGVVYVRLFLELNENITTKTSKWLYVIDLSSRVRTIVYSFTILN